MALKNASPSPLLETAFLCERWGVQAILGDMPDFVVINKMTRLLNVYRIFEKSKTVAGMKNLTAGEKLTRGRVIALTIEQGDNNYLERCMYED